MPVNLSRMSLKARLFLLTVASVGLMCAYVLANGAVRNVMAGAEDTAQHATYTLMAANTFLILSYAR